MMLKMLNLSQASLIVRRTGLPFYDAARVIGVAQLFFGTSSVTVTETSFGWILKGITNLKEPDLRRFWIGVRLSLVEAKRPSAVLMPRLKIWEQGKLSSKWKEVCNYFCDPFASHKIVSENVYNETEAALMGGTRGFDPNIYSHFRAEGGIDAKEPEQENLVALLGLSHAARVNNTMFLLPIFGRRDEANQFFGSRDGADQSFPVTTAHYWNYNYFFRHAGGEKIAATWAMLSMLENLFGQGLPVQDFAYNRAERPIYHSGTLGAEKLCRCWHSGCESTLREIGRYLQATQREKGGHGADLARTLAEFALNPDAAGLERVVRLKARAMADEDNRAKSLLRQPETLEEITRMLSTNNVEIPSLPENLCQVVRRALNTSDKGWIGRYLKLENATSVNQFFEEIERLLSRSAMANKRGNMAQSITYPAIENEKPLTEYIAELKNPRDFRAFRAAFLLRVLQIPFHAVTTASSAPEAAEEADANEDTKGDEE